MCVRVFVSFVIFLSLFKLEMLCGMSLSGLFLFFFFKQKTAYEMRISDWSSDVCSSDLVGVKYQLAIKRLNRQHPTRRYRSGELGRRQRHLFLGERIGTDRRHA